MPLFVKSINFICFKAFIILFVIKYILLLDKSKISKFDKPKTSSILLSSIPLQGSIRPMLLFFKEINFKLFFKFLFDFIWLNRLWKLSSINPMFSKIKCVKKLKLSLEAIL